MAGEYVRWLARNEKPREKRELTPEEKRRNWWDYHKWHVVIAIVCAVLLADLIYDSVWNRRNSPDYVVAYVGQTALPDSLARIAEEGLAQLGEDINGNGEVRVELRQFIIAEEDQTSVAIALEDTQRGYASSLLLQGNIETVESMVFLLEDPELFASAYPILSRVDGTLPEDTPDSQMPVYHYWGDCPALTGLELPNFEVPVIHGTLEGDSQLALSGLAVARRGLWDDGTNDSILAGIALWERMTEGME